MLPNSVIGLLTIVALNHTVGIEAWALRHHMLPKMAGLTRNFLRCARIWSTPFNRTQIALQFKKARIFHTGVPYFSARKDLLSCVQLEIDMENVQPLPVFKKFEVCLSILSPLVLMQCTVYFHVYFMIDLESS